jgi:hypothetical protein
MCRATTAVLNCHTQIKKGEKLQEKKLKSEQRMNLFVLIRRRHKWRGIAATDPPPVGEETSPGHRTDDVVPFVPGSNAHEQLAVVGRSRRIQ